MSSDEVDKKTVEENPKDTASSEEEVEEKINSKPAAKKKADPPKIKQPAKKRVKTEQVEKETKKEEKKKEKQAEKEEEEEEEDEDSAEENGVENHKAVPLLDQPLEVSGSRKRKEVQRFQPVEQKEELKAVQIPEGKGKALGDIPRIELGIQRAKVDDLKLLHRLCFGKPGKATVLKKNIRKFNGFEFEEASDDYEKKKVTIEKGFKKVTVAHLKNICNIIDIEKSGTKDDILARILSFLTCPVDSGKTLPGEGRTKRKGVASKNYDEGEEKFDSKKKGSGKSKKKDDDSEESGKEESENEKEESEEETPEVKKNDKKKEDSQTTEDSEPEEEKEEEEEEEKPKKGAKKGKKAAEVAAEKKAPPKKRGAAKKVPEKKPEVEKDEEEDNDSESDEPQSKKPKAPPTDEEIKTYVKSLLEGANLELITMKKVCQDVYAHYPDFDLGHKKDFIKTTVKSLISS